MIGYKQALGSSMIGHKKPLGSSMIGYKKPLGEMAVQLMTSELGQQKKSGGLERAKRNEGWNKGGQYSG